MRFISVCMCVLYFQVIMNSDTCSFLRVPRFQVLFLHPCIYVYALFVELFKMWLYKMHYLLRYTKCDYSCLYAYMSMQASHLKWSRITWFCFLCLPFNIFFHLPTQKIFFHLYWTCVHYLCMYLLFASEILREYESLMTKLSQRILEIVLMCFGEDFERNLNWSSLIAMVI